MNEINIKNIKLDIEVFEKYEKKILNNFFKLIIIAQCFNFKLEKIKLSGKNKNENFIQEIKQFEKKHKITIKKVSSSKKINEVNNLKRDYIIFTKVNGLVKFESLLKRLRNSFCHNNFNIINNRVFLKDINIQNNKALTMIGDIRLSVFIKLLNIIAKYIKD